MALRNSTASGGQLSSRSCLFHYFLFCRLLTQPHRRLGISQSSRASFTLGSR